MKAMFAAASVVSLFLAGCDGATTNPTKPSGTTVSSEGTLAGTTLGPGGIVPLTADNTTIEFIGTHTPPKDPEPRHGTFQKFNGTATFDRETRSVAAITVDIETASIKTEFDKLTNHLNSPDFFDAREYPSAKFVSTKITPADGGTQTVTGDLTLLGNTKEISFPVTIESDASGLTLKGSFTIDRTEFGMNKVLEAAQKDVTVNVTVGPIKL